MQLVVDRLNANKPPQNQDSRKVTSAQLNNNKDLDVDLKKEEPTFFGSFFPAVKGGKKKGGPIMEAVSRLAPSRVVLTSFPVSQPPAVIRPQAALNERETMETEVIST